MSPPKLNQLVSVFADWNTLPPGDGGILGGFGVVIGFDRDRNTCAVELYGSRRVVESPAHKVFPIDSESRGVISPDGTYAAGAYRTRTGRCFSFTFRKTDRSEIHFEFRKQLSEEHTRYCRIDVEVPLAFELSRDSIRATLQWIVYGDRKSGDSQSDD